jgi:hypothetical protein
LTALSCRWIRTIFVNTYFKELIKVLCPLGIEPDPLVKAIWGGTGAMVKNDGSARNDEVFWRTYGEMTGTWT